MDIPEGVERALIMARRVLATLEIQAAGYTVLDIPATLVIELEDKRKEIKALERRLKGEEESFNSNSLPRRETFFGREKEIERALNGLHFDYRGWGILIDGIGGIGKTALAIELAYVCQEKKLFDHFVFVTAKATRLTSDGEHELTGGSLSLHEIVVDISEQLRSIDQNSDQPSSHTTQTTDEKGKEDEKLDGFLSDLQYMSGPRSRVLLIVDNLETLTDSEQYLLLNTFQRLPMPCKAIVTSRKHIGEGVVHIRLDKLEWVAAEKLMLSETKRSPIISAALKYAGRREWIELYNATGGSPLALTWMLRLIEMRNLSLERALQLFRSKQDFDSPLHEFMYREIKGELSQNDEIVLGTLARYPKPIGFDTLINVTRLSRSALEVVIERLGAFSLINFHDPDGPYWLHPLTQKLAEKEYQHFFNPEFKITKRTLENELSKQIWRADWLQLAPQLTSVLMQAPDNLAYRSDPSLFSDMWVIFFRTEFEVDGERYATVLEATDYDDGNHQYLVLYLTVVTNRRLKATLLWGEYLETALLSPDEARVKLAQVSLDRLIDATGQFVSADLHFSLESIH